MKHNNKVNNKINGTSCSILIGVLLCSMSLSGYAVSIKKVEAQDLVSNDITVLNVQEEDIASGTYGSSKWNIDAEGTLHIEEGKFSNFYPTNVYRSYWQPYSAQIKNIIFEGKVIANENSRGLFQELEQVKEIHNLSYLDTSNVLDMSNMFKEMYSLEELDVSSFDTSNVTNMSGMFAGSSSLKNLDVSSFDTSNVTNMSSMFANSSSLKNLDVSSFDTSNVLDMSIMFKSLSSIHKLDISHFNTSSVTNMSNMFYGLLLTDLNLSNFDTSNVVDMSNMFANMTSLLDLDIINFDTSKVTNMRGMFYRLKSLVNIDVTKFNTSNVTDMSDMFNNMNSLNNLDVSNFDTSNVVKMSNMFRSLESLTNLDLSNFDTTNVVDMSGMFFGAGMTKLNISAFNTSNVTKISNMFSSTKNLDQLDVSNFNTSNVTDMSGIFSGTRSLTALDVSNFDTSNVTTMSNMFARAGLINIDVSNFNTTKVKDMSQMFQDTEVTHLDLSNFDMANVTNVAWMLWAPRLSQLTLGDKFNFGSNGSTLLEVPLSEEENILGKWINVGEGSTEAPSGTNVWSSSELESNYKGERDADTYVWQRKIPSGGVRVKYLNEEGKEIHKTQTINGNIGDNYDVSTSYYKIGITGYILDESRLPVNAKGEMSDTVQVVTYIYNKEHSVTTPSKKEAVSVYRLYNKKSKEHLYTIDSYEYKHLPELSNDWVREGVNFKEYKSSDSTTVTVYRVYNPKSGEHLNTTDSNEVKVLTSKGWKSEGVAFYAPKTEGKPVYRLFNPKAGIGAHFMTADSYEKSVLTKAPKEWKYEGVAWYSVK